MRTRSPLLWLLLGLAGCSERAIPAAAGDGSTCEATYRVLSSTHFACAAADYPPVPVLAAADGRVVYTDKRTLGTNSASDTDLFALHPGSGSTEQITGDDHATILVGVDGQAILFSTHEGGQQRQHLRLHTGGVMVDLGDHDVDSFLSFSSYTDGPARPLDRGQAAWRTEQGIYIYDGSVVRKIAALIKPGYNYGGSGPYLDGGSLVWSEWDGEDLEVFLFMFADGQTRQLTDNSTTDSHPVISDGRVFWRCDGNICTWADDTGAGVEVLDTGDCQAPDTFRGSAAWICDNQVALFDGQQVRRLTSDGDATERAGVRLHDGKLVWLEIRDPEQSPYDGHGTLVFSDTRSQQDVAEVGLPCIFCDAYWPPLSLSLSADVVAWTYALPPWPGLGQCGCAEIERRCAR